MRWPRRGGPAQSRGATAAQSTRRASPRRQRVRPSRTGQPPPRAERRRRRSSAGSGRRRPAVRELPLPVEFVQQGVNALARHVAVDQRLRQPLGDDRRLSSAASRSEIVKVSGPDGAERDPAGHAADLVAGALDEHAARLQPRRHRRPGFRDLALVVLPQHIERADHRRAPRAGGRDLEAAEPKGDAVTGGGRRDPDPLRIDLDADHLDVGPHAASRSRSSRVVVADAP